MPKTLTVASNGGSSTERGTETLRREVEDDLWAAFAEQTDQVGVGDVGLDELEVRMLTGPIEVHALPELRSSMPTTMSVREQAVYQRRADENRLHPSPVSHRPPIPTAAKRR